MDKVINYIFESGISLALLTTIYVLFLRKETFFKQNRMFLLGSILFSVIIPLVKLPAITSLGPVMLPEVTISPYKSILKVMTVYGRSNVQDFNTIAGLMDVLIYTYLAGVIYFSLRLLYRILRIMLLIKRSEVKAGNGYKLVLVDEYFSPFSFLNYVFVSRSVEKNDDYDKMILHELEHVKQGHTVDILLLEVLTVFHWFNPFVWLLKRVVRENHEFLADTGVLSKGVNRIWYKQLLLNQYVGQQYIISNSFNYSLIKKRIKMMSKIRSSRLAGLKYFFGFITIAVLVFAFGCEQKSTIPGGNDPVFFVVEKMPQFPGGEDSLRTYISKSLKYPVAAQDSGIQGRVYVSFVIGKDGKVKDAEIARGVTPLLDDEAIRVIENMPAWKPGMQRGFPVAVKFTVPINFVLNGVEDPHIKKASKIIKPIKGDDGIYVYVAQMPDFPGGEEAFHNYLAKSVKHPVDALKKGIQGRVFVSFVVDENGDITKVKLARGADPLLDKEAMRVIRNMPKWKPGYQDGKPVKVYYTVPVNFVAK